MPKQALPNSCRSCSHFREGAEGSHCLRPSHAELIALCPSTQGVAPRPEEMTCDDYEPP